MSDHDAGGLWSRLEKATKDARFSVALESYIRGAGERIMQATMLFDYSISAEKMLDWRSVGTENSAWKIGPYISVGASEEQIDRSRPYCLMISKENSVAASLVLGKDPKIEPNGGVRSPLKPMSKNEWHSEPLVAKLAIIEQFEYYKDFAVNFGLPFNKRTAKGFGGDVEDWVWITFRKTINRRNELVHDAKVAPPTMKEAVEYYWRLRLISIEFLKSISENTTRTK